MMSSSFQSLCRIGSRSLQMGNSYCSSRPASSAMSSHCCGAGPMQSGSVPVHPPGNIDEQLAHPGLVPGQAAAQRVAEEAVQRDARPAQVADLAVEHGPAGGRVEAELAHAEAGGARVAAGAGVEHVEERVVGAPERRRRARGTVCVTFFSSPAFSSTARRNRLPDRLAAFPGLDAAGPARRSRPRRNS